MKNSFLIITTFIIYSLAFLSCGDDDDAVMTDDSQTQDIDELREESSLLLTGGTSKTWKISSAVLDANGNNLDISANFNVTDDEFIFTGTATDGFLEWRPGNAINLEGSTLQETLLDYYLEPVTTPTVFDEDSAENLSSLNGEFSFTIIDPTTITGTIRTAGRASVPGELTITLSPKTPADYADIPNSGLNFSLVTQFTTNNASILGGEGPTGFTGSYSDNSFYIVSRDASQNDPNLGSPEQILKYNLDTGTLEENLFYQPQFITKRLNIINNELVVFGGQYVNTYPLNPNGDATTVFEHGLFLTRFGFAVQGDFAYLAGGSTANESVPAVIRRYHYLTNEISEIATLPVPRFFGGTETVNNKLFVFGGRPTFPGGGDPDAQSFIVDLTSGAVSNFDMPDAPYLSYAARNEHLIYVGYETRIDNGSGDFNNFDRQINFGVYNTLDDSFTTINHNLDNSGQFTTISALTIFNGKLFVIYGDLSNTDSVSIFSAPI